MKTMIIWLAILIGFSGNHIIGQDIVPEKTNPKKYFAEGTLGVNLMGDQRISTGIVGLNATLGSRLKHNLSYGLSFNFANNYNNYFNQKVYYVYLGNPFNGYRTYTIRNKDGYSLGIKPFIRKNEQLLNRLILNIDIGIGLNFSNFSNSSLDTSPLNPGGGMEEYKSKTYSANIFMDFSFVFKFHKSLGLTVGFQGAQIEISKTTCETENQEDSFVDEIKTLNFNLFKNLHKPYVGFILYF